MTERSLVHCYEYRNVAYATAARALFAGTLAGVVLCFVTSRIASSSVEERYREVASNAKLRIQIV